MILSLILFDYCVTDVTKNLKCGGSYIDSPDWMINETEKINSASDYDNYFQYATTVTLNHENIRKEFKKIKLLLNLYY